MPPHQRVHAGLACSPADRASPEPHTGSELQLGERSQPCRTQLDSRTASLPRSLARHCTAQLGRHLAHRGAGLLQAGLLLSVPRWVCAKHDQRI